MLACEEKRGTEAGWWRHQRKDEETCAECLTAAREGRARRARKYRKNNAEKVAAYNAERSEAQKAYKCEWRKANPDRNRVYMARKRVAKRGSAHLVFTPEQLAQRMAYYGKCWICGDPGWAHADHVKPLSKGGPHILANLRPACANCNMSKGSKWPFEKPWR